MVEQPFETMEDKVTHDAVDAALDGCIDVENASYKKGFEEGRDRLNDEAFESGKQYGYSPFCKSVNA